MLSFSPPDYVAFVYNSFWWVGIVSLVDIVACDVINFDFMHPHERPLIKINVVIHVMFL